MHIDLTKRDGAISFVATSEAGHEVPITASPEAGGDGRGARPMEMVAMSLGGCSSIDVLSILEKQRQPPDHFAVHIDAERSDDAPRVFTALHLHYKLEGDLTPQKVERAIELSLQTYCSVAAMLRETAALTYSLTVNGAQVVDAASTDQFE